MEGKGGGQNEIFGRWWSSSVYTNLYWSLWFGKNESSLLRRLCRPLHLCVPLLLLLKGEVFTSSFFYMRLPLGEGVQNVKGVEAKIRRFERMRNTCNIFTVASIFMWNSTIVKITWAFARKVISGSIWTRWSYLIYGRVRNVGTSKQGRPNSAKIILPLPFHPTRP